MLFTEANMDVVYNFYGNRNTFECEFEYEYEYVANAVFMDIWIIAALKLPKASSLRRAWHPSGRNPAIHQSRQVADATVSRHLTHEAKPGTDSDARDFVGNALMASRYL